MLRDIFLPSTDAGALVQLLVFVCLWVPAVAVARKNREVMVFVIGVGVMVLAWFALRTVH